MNGMLGAMLIMCGLSVSVAGAVLVTQGIRMLMGGTP